jgi:uncharacterized protein YkwD
MGTGRLTRQLLGVAVGGLMLVSPIKPAEVGAWFVKDDPACPHSSQVPGATDEARTAKVVVCLLNARRAEAGLPALRLSEQLLQSARGHARAMVAQRFFGSVSPDGISADQRIAATGYLGVPTGENIAWGAGADAMPVRVVESWMASPTHRANVLNPELTEVGVGIAPGSPEAGPEAEGTAYTVDLGAGV